MTVYNVVYADGRGPDWRSFFQTMILMAAGVLVMTIIVGFVCVQIGWCAEELKASWYSSASLVKEGTRRSGEPQIQANGKPFDENAMTCACRLYPLGTTLRITNIRNGRVVVVIVTDRIGKRFATKRIDLAKAAFKQIANLNDGIVPIKAEVVK